jgi:hypothetical protein
MANLVDILLQVVDSTGNVQSSLPAVLYNQSYSDPFHPIPTSVLRSGTTDGSGRVMFTGIGAGVYDIGVSTNDGISYLRNYYVKNEYVVVPGTSLDFESRTYVEAQSQVTSPGILTQHPVNNTGTGYYATNSGTEAFGLPFPVSGSATTVNVSTTRAKESGSSYYHLNGSQLFQQKVRMKV